MYGQVPVCIEMSKIAPKAMRGFAHTHSKILGVHFWDNTLTLSNTHKYWLLQNILLPKTGMNLGSILFLGVNLGMFSGIWGFISVTLFMKEAYRTLRKRNYKGRVTKRYLPKCSEVCRTFDNLMTSYADILSANDDVQEFRCNVLLDGILQNEYTSDFVCIEIYNKMYLATMLSLKKKNSQLAIKQKNSNFMAMQGKAEYRGIIGGSDSFTIIGTSGIGKSSAIQKSIELISSNKLLKCDNTKIIPCVQVQCPFDASPKGMLMSVLKAVDDALDTDYYMKSQKRSVTTDILIGSVAQVCINHIGLLVIDEIQHVYGHKNGIMLINMITQLINVSGVSICLVGTEESISFFERSPQLARRTIGLKYNPLPYDDYFKEFCELVF